jgi:two-component system NtrC family sensor kinase
LLPSRLLAKLDNGVVAWIGAGLAVLATFLCITIWASDERAKAVDEHGFRAAANLAHVLEEQTVRSIQAVDLTLGAIVDTLRLVPSSEHDADFEESMRRRLPTLPYVRAFFVVGPDGYITQDTDHPFTPRANLADRPYFKAHAENPWLGALITAPLLSRSTGTWFFAISRRVAQPDGSFGGVAVAAIEVRYFEAFYRALQLGKHDTINLFMRDGTMLLRAPLGDAVLGGNYADHQLFRDHLPKSDVGALRAVMTSDGRSRIISYRAARDYPIVVAVMLSEQAIIATWRQNTIAAYAAASAFALILGTLTFFYVRYRRRYESAREHHMHAQNLETLGQMTGGIAHDVNNLLAVIASSNRMLRRSGELGQRSHAILEAAEAAVESGRALTARLLAFAKRQELQVHSADVNVLLTEIEPLLRQAAGIKINIEMALSPGLWHCALDSAQFDSAILNLVVNARDAMPAGGRVRIATKNVPAEAAAHDYGLAACEHVGVTVSDNGAGMAPGTVRRALEPFFTTKGERGTGLGLSQVYGFVRQLGGDVKIDSRPNSGTSVTLLFPRSAAAQAELRAASSSAAAVIRVDAVAARDKVRAATAAAPATARADIERVGE